MDTEETRRRWAERTGAYSPAYYAHYGPNRVSRRLAELLADAPGTDGAVLEIGCGSGRHLAHLHDQGFGDLTGVDVNPEAAHVLHTTYPALADVCTLYIDPIEDLVEEVPGDAFEAVFAVETLQHIHPDATGVFEGIADIAADRLITVETEGDPAAAPNVIDGVPLYYRRYDAVFGDTEFDQVAVETRDRGTLRVFE
ncbi:MAG: class I SAM-dependent methyltransferase [Halobacteriaceae archaeon]